MTREKYPSFKSTYTLDTIIIPKNYHNLKDLVKRYNETRLYTRAKLAKLIGVCEKSVRNFVNDGKVLRIQGLFKFIKLMTNDRSSGIYPKGYLTVEELKSHMNRFGGAVFLGKLCNMTADQIYNTFKRCRRGGHMSPYMYYRLSKIILQCINGGSQ